MNPAFDVILPSTIEIGTRILVIRSAHYHIGRYGYIVSRHPKYQSIFGVKLDHQEDSTGHNLDGVLDIDSTDGWWFDPDELEIVI